MCIFLIVGLFHLLAAAIGICAIPIMLCVFMPMLSGYFDQMMNAVPTGEKKEDEKKDEEKKEDGEEKKEEGDDAKKEDAPAADADAAANEGGEEDTLIAKSQSH